MGIVSQNVGNIVNSLYTINNCFLSPKENVGFLTFQNNYVYSDFVILLKFGSN